jgi:hypothetical protein
MTRTKRLDRDALDRMLIQQIDVIARPQALAVGATDNSLRHWVRPGGPWRSLLPGVYMAATGRPTTLQQEMAALLYAGPGSVITGPAALRCHHIGTQLTDLVDVLVPAGRQRRDAAFARLHRTSRLPGRIWEVGPVRYVPPPRAVADAVRILDSLRDVRATVADAVQRGKCTVKDLLTELTEGPNTGSALFRQALAEVADGIRSAAEGDLRDLLLKSESDLPMPLFNASLYDEAGTFIACPTPGGPSTASRSRWIRGSGTCRRRITRRP